jgi:eukaryotic-like serine/threonine-protein kinase
MYALGVIAYELLSGSLPFTGPDFRDQHLNRSPAQLSSVPGALGALAEECRISRHRRGQARAPSSLRLPEQPKRHRQTGWQNFRRQIART